MRPTSVTPQALLIPLLAFIAVVALGTTPLGDAFRTFPGLGREEKTASIVLTGIEKPKVEMTIAEAEGKAWIQMGIARAGSAEGFEGGESVKVILPASWHLEEVRGIHVRDLGTKDLGQGTREFSFPYSLQTTHYSLQFVFTTDTPFDALHFSHDSVSPALFSLTRLHSSGNAPEEIVKFVEDTVTILL